MPKEDLEAILDYMYAGTVKVAHSSLASLLHTAEGLQVKGLIIPDHFRGTPSTSKFILGFCCAPVIIKVQYCVCSLPTFQLLPRPPLIPIFFLALPTSLLIFSSFPHPPYSSHPSPTPLTLPSPPHIPITLPIPLHIIATCNRVIGHRLIPPQAPGSV